MTNWYLKGTQVRITTFSKSSGCFFFFAKYGFIIIWKFPFKKNEPISFFDCSKYPNGPQNQSLKVTQDTVLNHLLGPAVFLSMIWSCPVRVCSELRYECGGYVGHRVSHCEVLKSQQQALPAITQNLPHILQHKNNC